MKERLPLTSEQTAKESLCASCIGACCMAKTIMELSPQEAEYMQDAGTDLQVLSKQEVKAISGGRKAPKPDRGSSYYMLTSDCGNLDQETRQCGDYENRPNVCREFDEGSYQCGRMRDVRMAQYAVELGMPTMPAREDEAVPQYPEAV